MPVSKSILYLYIYVYIMLVTFSLSSFFIFDIINIQFARVEFILSIAYILTILITSKTIYTTTLNSPRARYRNGLATWSSLIGSLCI